MLDAMLNAIRNYLYDGSDAADFLPSHIVVGHAVDIKVNRVNNV